MKKIIFCFFIMLTLLGCYTTTSQITRTNVIKKSSFLSAKVERVVGDKILLELENKGNDFLEVKLSESYINNEKILDYDKMFSNSLEEISTSLKNASINFENSANINNPFYQKQYSVSNQKVDETANDIVIPPKERIIVEVGTNIFSFPMKMVIKYTIDRKIEFIYLIIENTGLIEKVDTRTNQPIK